MNKNHVDEHGLAMQKRKKRNSWIIFGVFLFMRFFFVEHFAVPSSSMTSTLLTGDIILIKKYCYSWSRLSIPFGGYLPFKKRLILGKPKYGDIAVFVLNRDPSTYYVKRIVALAGDRVQMVKGVLSVNGIPVNFAMVSKFTFRNDAGQYETGENWKISMPFAKNKNGDSKEYTVYRNEPIGKGHIDDTLEFVVPKGHVWVQGDFHTGSADSFSPHFMGPIPEECLVGKPFFVIYGTNSRLSQESNWGVWIIQLPWRVLVALKNTNFKRIFVSVQ